MLKRWWQDLRYGYFSRQKQQAFLEDISALLDDGVTLTQAIETVRVVSSGVTQRVASRISQLIAQGKPLADGMQGWFARSLVEVIRAGEMSGTLTKTLQVAAESFAQHSSAVREFLTGLVYPVLVLVLSGVMLIFIRHSVLDSFAAIRPIIMWPDIGQTLYSMGFMIEHWWPLMLFFLGALFFLLRQLLLYFTGSLRHYLDRLPFVSLYRDVKAARFMETLGLLLANGVVLKKALSIMHRDADPYLSSHILKMEFQLSGGQENIADVLNTQLIHPHDLVRLRTVSKSKGFAQALTSLSIQANRRCDRTIHWLGKMIGGVLLLLSAMTAATIIFGIYAVGSSIAG